ncbi:hypothetical protein IFM89_003069 [Coptis chinensis]|uniref:ENT domain-containing protein n=1 Tax=Coptis chinensis TaxID=261450 RepID=A0A835IA95_9MAGN|nr:hypothetical protein IFM89_003069 [Coptis chinensis]
MRFKTGSKVEVFSKGVPFGSWRTGEIVSGDGRYYDIWFDSALGVSGTSVYDSVLRKSVRPCPPPVHGLREWVEGDYVEVFEGMSWKVGIVLRVSGRNYYMVRLVGSSEEVRAHKCEVRLRQVWKNDNWVVVGKDLCEFEKSDLRYYEKPSCKVPVAGVKRKLCEGDAGFQESHMVTSRTLKRGSGIPMDLVAHECAKWNTKANANEGRHQQMAAERSSQLPEKVDAVASPQYMLGEICMHGSQYNQISIFNTERGEPKGDVGCFVNRSVDCNDTESSICSVGSCSINSNIPYRSSHCSLKNPNYDSDSSCSSDAESCCDWRHDMEYPRPSKEDLAGDIHKLELNAYHCTMGALYASGGPLSWEQEELVTNLRLMLHISNDEHLKELRANVGGLCILLPKV